MAVSGKGGSDIPAQEVHEAPDGYAELTRIGEGGFAVVYCGLDTRFDRTVALKILRSDSLDERGRRRFNAECLAIGRVSSHPNIVTVYDTGTTRGHRPWLAMEYCSGGSLAHKVARQGPLPVAEVISIGARLCSALSAAHEAGILHRDVKPHNVLLTCYGEPALADFGIARVRMEEGAAEVTNTETTAYTVVHAAPEILEGSAGTAAADIYSLGSTLYTLLAGQAPFAKEASTGLAPLVARILRNDLPVITRPGVPPELERLLRRSMAAHPDDRPTSAAELGASLAVLAQQLASEPAARLSTKVRPAVASCVTPRRVLGTLTVTLGILVALFLALRPGSSGSEPGPVGSSIPVLVAAPGSGQPAASYAPQDLAVRPGPQSGDLVVTWRMPPRPDVVATVIYEEGAGTTRARAVVNYAGNADTVPRATLHGLAGGHRICLSAAHLVSIDDKITNVLSRPVCGAPR